jgi:hypothetical protein
MNVARVAIQATGSRAVQAPFGERDQGAVRRFRDATRTRSGFRRAAFHATQDASLLEEI